MSQRRRVYSNIRSLDQLRAERNALGWHIKSVEDRFRKRTGRLRDTFSQEGQSNFFRWLLLAIPSAVSVYKLVSGFFSGGARRR